MTSHIKTTRFWLAWIFASLLVYPLVAIFLIALTMVLSPILTAVAPSYSYYDSGATLETVYMIGFIVGIGGVVGFAVGLLQKTVIKRYFHFTVYSWQRTTAIGGMIAAPVMALAIHGMTRALSDNYWQFYESGYYSPLSSIIAVMPMVIYVTVLSAIQVVILRRYVSHAWLWILANTTAGMMFSMLVNSAYEPHVGNWILAAIAQGAVTGFAMLWLLHNLNKELATEEPQEFAYQHVPIDTEDPSDPSVWDDAI
jgi:hypothetical protein